MRAQPQAPHTQDRLEPLSTSSVCQLLLEMPLSGGSALVSNKLSDIRTRERPRRFQDLNAPPRLELTPESKYPTPPRDRGSDQHRPRLPAFSSKSHRRGPHRGQRSHRPLCGAIPVVSTGSDSSLCILPPTSDQRVLAINSKMPL